MRTPTDLRYCLLESTVRDTLDDDATWWERIGRTQKCSGCGNTRHYYPSPLDAVVQLRQRASMSLSGRSCIRILRQQLYNVLRPYMPGVVPGTVRFADGRIQKESVTIHCPPEMGVVIRGGIGSSGGGGYGVCKVCGSRWSIPGMLKSPLHLLLSEVPHREVLNTGIWLIVSHRLTTLLELSAFPDVRVEPVEVFERPVEAIAEFGEN